MRTTERLDRLAEWTYNKLCKGRLMKSPASGMDFTKIEKVEPKVYVGYFPMRPEETADGQAWQMPNELYTVPSILIMPTHSFVKYQEEKRFDRYSGINRPQELGQGLNCQVLFSMFEDGVRKPGFIQKVEDTGEYDLKLVREGTRDGLYMLLNWIDDFKAALLGEKFIPKTDLFLNEAEMTYGLYADQKYITDKRPLYYGFVNVAFQCYADEKQNHEIEKLLE